MIYPWHQHHWLQLVANWHNRPNAWLFVGKAKTGKSAFAQYLAQALLCENPEKDYQPCGQCPSCHLFEQGSHPDFMLLTPGQDEDTGNARKLLQIKIDSVREVLQFSQITSHRGGLKVIVINPAESMNVQAANALLKVLEEPPQNVVFILVSSQKDRLLPTIKSRCRPFVLDIPDKEQALSFLREQQVADAASLLAFNGGAPLFEDSSEHNEIRAQLTELLSEPALIAFMDFAAKFDQKKWPLALFLDWMQKWISDLVWVRYNTKAYFYPDYTDELKKIGQNIQMISVFEFLAQLNKLIPYGQHTLNVKLQIESVVIDYLNLIKS
jgi:DNA polymerase-3 subunit delta'